MEQSRARTLLGLGLVLVGCVLLFRTALAPIAPFGAGMSNDRSAAWSEQQAQHEMQLAQQEAQREMQLAQQEMQLAQQEAQREMQEAQREMQLAQQEAQREMQEAQREAFGGPPEIAPLPELPAMPPLAPMAPEPPALHGASGLNPALLLIALGIGLFWWHRRNDHSPRRV